MSEIIKTNQIQEALSNGSEILQTNRERVSKGVAFGQNIIADIKANGMSPALDEKCNKFLVLCRTAKKEMNEARKPFTTLLASISKEFTTLENSLDVKKEDTEAYIIQSYRDDYVKKIREEEERKQREAQLKLDKEKELIEIKAQLESEFSEYLRAYVNTKQEGLKNTFNAITLEDYDQKAENLKALKIKYDQEHYKRFVFNGSVKFHSEEEVQAFTKTFLDGKSLVLISEIIENDISAVRDELIEKLPSLKNELDALAKADAEEKERLEREKAERIAKEKADAETKADAERKKREAEIETKKMAEQAEAMMNTQTDLFDTKDDKPETRDGFNIEILHPAGIAEIFSFWFEKEGKDLPTDQVLKKSVGQMKAFCEKQAHKTSEMIDSKFLKYESVYKAVNRK